MAVRVVKLKPDSSAVKKVICPHCGATLEYLPNDVQSYHGTDMGGGPDGSEWIKCANKKCGKVVTLRSW